MEKREVPKQLKAFGSKMKQSPLTGRSWMPSQAVCSYLMADVYRLGELIRFFFFMSAGRTRS